MATYKFLMDITADDLSAVEEALDQLGDNVQSRDVDVDAKSVTVTTTASAEDVEEALRRTGKEVRMAL